MGFLIFEERTDTLHQNVGNKVPTNASQHPKTAKISFQTVHSPNRA